MRRRPRGVVGLAAAGLALAGLAGGGAAQTSQRVVEVPLAVEGGVLVVPVETASGETLRFQVNPGSGVTILAEATARRLGDEASLTLAGLPLAPGATRPDAALARPGVAIDGMVGADLLREFDVLLDAPRGRMLLREVRAPRPWEGVALGEPVRLTVLHGVILTLEVALGGRRWPAMLAMSSPATVASPAVGEALGIDGSGRETLGIGDATFPDAPVVVEDLEVFRRFRPDGSGFVLVGSALAHECAVALSWAHREIRSCAP